MAEREHLADDIDSVEPRDIVRAAWSRFTEFYISDTRNARVGNEDTIQWKKRTREFDALYRGDWVTVFPNEMSSTNLPKVQNLPQVGSDDLSRVATQSRPDVWCPPISDDEKDRDAARLRQGILDTYWSRGRGDLILPYLVLDLASSGTCFLASIYPTDRQGRPIPGSYPYPYRLDPRGCYPDVINGQLQDLIVTQRIRTRQAEALLDIDLASWAGDASDIEIVDYLCVGGIVRVLTRSSGAGPVGDPYMYSKIDYGTDSVPVAFAMLPTADGHFRGLYDQVKGILAMQNRLATLITDYADQGVYAPWMAYGIANAEERPGPNTIYKGVDEKATMQRVQPAISNPQLMGLLEFLETQARGGAFYPQSRGGEVSQSIASGTFVNSTQGNFTDEARFVMGLLGDVREQFNAHALEIDERIGGQEKRLAQPVGQKFTYIPKTDIAGVYDNKVIYGAGAGLDYLNRMTVIEQLTNTRMMSRDTGRGMVPDITDPDAEKLKIAQEDVETALLQKALTSGDTMVALKLLRDIAKGMSLGEAAEKIVTEQEQAAQQAQQQGQEPEAPTPQEGTEKANAVPPGPQPEEAGAGIPFTPSQPLTNVTVGR